MNHSKLPKTIVALGLVSLFMDISSEMIHSLLPLFLVTVLGASALSVGFIEGIAEATASIAKVFSGVISDWMGRRKLLILLGYGLAALTKPLFPLAQGIGAVLTARFIDRIGKGIRGDGCRRQLCRAAAGNGTDGDDTKQLSLNLLGGRAAGDHLRTADYFWC